MAKYRGKYTNCRTCKHVERVGMVLVTIKESCKYGIPSDYGMVSTTYHCQECKHCEPEEIK